MANPIRIHDCNSIEFQRIIEKSRQAEDRLVFRLNSELPTASFSEKLDKNRICSEFKEKLHFLRKIRADIIHTCTEENLSIVNDSKNDETRLRDVQTACFNLRQLKDQNAIDEIITQQSDKILRERCTKEMY